MFIQLATDICRVPDCKDLTIISGKPNPDPDHVDYVPTIFSHTPVVKKTPQILQQKLDRQNRTKGREDKKNKSAAALALLALAERKENEVPGIGCQASPIMKDNSCQTETSGACYEAAVNMWDEQCSIINQQAVLTESYISVCNDLKAQCTELNCKLQTLQQQISQLQEENKKLSEKVETCFGHSFIVNSDTKTSYYTGLPNYATFVTIFNQASKHVKRKNTKLVLQDEMLLTLTKLKQNPGMEDLAYRFGISISLVTKIFHVWLDALYCALSALIIWPTTDYLQLPDAFNNDRFKNVRCIIDCTEIFIDRPRGLKARAQTYSNYKKHNTVKFLIGISPSGCVTFLSDCWGGRVSDKKITMESGLLDKLLPGDVVMADRGFTMTEDFAMKGAKLIVPSFTKGKRQLSPCEVEESRQMSRARIHVERIIGRTKDFRILKETLPISLIKRKNSSETTCEKIMAVVSGCVNTNPPLL